MAMRFGSPKPRPKPAGPKLPDITRFQGCQYCHGAGCLKCPEEYAEYERDMRRPLFVARRDVPEDMEKLRTFMGAEALQKAFGPGGEGMAEVERNAVIARITQLLDDERNGREHADYSPIGEPREENV